MLFFYGMRGDQERGDMARGEGRKEYEYNESVCDDNVSVKIDKLFFLNYPIVGIVYH